MKYIVPPAAFGLITIAASSLAFAKADCKAYPKAEWMPQAEAIAKIEAQGFTINKFKADGNCYEIYGKNKAGKKVEIYFDVKTLEPVKSEVEQ
ncbi:MAG TPA: PepSY domain-containing protein [Methylibium sp.]